MRLPSQTTNAGPSGGGLPSLLSPIVETTPLSKGDKLTLHIPMVHLIPQTGTGVLENFVSSEKRDADMSRKTSKRSCLVCKRHKMRLAIPRMPNVSDIVKKGFKRLANWFDMI